jgi:hypothetical protein
VGSRAGLDEQEQGTTPWCEVRDSGAVEQEVHLAPVQILGHKIIHPVALFVAVPVPLGGVHGLDRSASFLLHLAADRGSSPAVPAFAYLYLSSSVPSEAVTAVALYANLFNIVAIVTV